MQAVHGISVGSAWKEAIVAQCAIAIRDKKEVIIYESKK